MPTATEDRQYWITTATRIARPVLTNLAAGTLKKNMPVEAAPKSKDRATVTHLEALGRTLTGLAPWLELAPDDTTEGKQRAQFADLARKSIASGTDPKSP